MIEFKNKRILIAVDPGEPELKPSESGLFWLRKWGSEQNSLLDVVHVASEASPRISERAFSDYVGALQLGKNVEHHVLLEPSTSRRLAVARLLDYSRKTGSSLIVVSSHGRSGPGRLVLGSFAENILASAPVPVLFLSDSSEQSPAQERVLFPTDFTEASKVAFDKFLDQISGFSGEVLLFHAVSPPGAVYDTGIMGVPVYLPESYWLEQKQWTDRECDQWVKIASLRGFKVRAVVQDGVLNTPMAIRKVAEEEKVALIGMASVSRGVQSAVLGSVAKEIFRSRKWPVWVCGPEAVEQEAKNASV